jgi:hypothetical protein
LLITFQNIKDFSNSLRNKNLIWQELSEITSLRNFNHSLQEYDSLINSNSYAEELLDDNPVHLALYAQNKILLAFNFKERADEKAFFEFNERFLRNKKMKISVQEGVVILSEFPELIESAMDKNRAKLINNSVFSHLEKESNYKGVSVYLRPPGEILPGNSISSVSLKPENITFNGISLPDTSSFYGFPEAEVLNDPEIFTKIPLVCNAFEIFATNNLPERFSNEGTSFWKRINDIAMFNARKQFYESLGNYLIRALLPSGDNALLVDVSDTLRFRELLPFFADSIFPEKKIARLKDTEGSMSFFPFLENLPVQYIFLCDNYFVLTETLPDAEIFSNSNRNNSSLVNNSDFANYASKNFDLGYHYLSYKSINSLKYEQLPLKQFLTSSEKEHFKNIGHFSMSGSYKQNQLNFRMNMKYFQENISSEPNLLWTLNNDAEIVTEPFPFVNHLTNAKELTYQLADKSLVLQSATGKILWKKKLPEKIVSNIFTVDAFKNGKNQLLFNTDNYLHLIDRNGNYVPGYPVKLPAAASNHLCVFDYENTRDYRLFIACNDNRIYNYSIWGIKQEGFKTFSVSAPITLPIRYCKVGLSDYLITADVKGKIYAFSRRGEGRIDFKNKFIENLKDFEVECGNTLANTQLLYYDDKNFLVNKISLSDKKEIFKSSESLEVPTVLYCDFDKNSVTNIVLFHKNLLEVYDPSGMKIFEQNNNDGFSAGAAGFFRNDSRVFLFVIDNKNENVLIANTDQKSVKKLKGNMLPLITDLFNDGKLYGLIVNGNTLRCFKL